MTATAPVLAALCALLEREGVCYTLQHHGPTLTSAESAAARGEALSVGAKALVVKADDEFRLVVVPADCRLDSAAVKRLWGVRKLRFATAAELGERTGLAPGSVPPFGRPILPLDLWVDEAVGREGRVAFNAGSLTTSMVLQTADYLRLAGARQACIAQPRTSAAD
jgi:Ala-tRNA(Pro) deacylase